MSFDDPDSDPDPDRPPRRRLRVVVTDGRGRVRRADRLRRWLAGVAPRPARGEVVVALVCDRKMRALNREFRGVDRATDVLSFPATAAVAPGAGIAPPTEAGAAGGGIEPAGHAAPDGDGQLEAGFPAPAAGLDGRAGEAGSAPRCEAGFPAPAAGLDGHPGEAGSAPMCEAGFPPPAADLERHLGDVVIATGVARRQARAAGHPLGAELRRLALHGLLHLLGYDHERDTGQMERLERRLRRRGGLA